MRINGRPVALEVQLLTIPRSIGEPLTLKVSAVSIGVRRDFDAIFPRPKPPMNVTNVRGEVKETENWRDPQFEKQLDERAHLENIYMFWRVLQQDENVKFDNTPDTIDNLRKLSAEIAESGFSEGDMLLVLKRAMAASNITSDEVDKAKKSF